MGNKGERSSLDYWDGKPSPARSILDDPVPSPLKSMRPVRTVLTLLAIAFVLMVVIAFALNFIYAFVR
jgi:hypothetical protein